MCDDATYLQVVFHLQTRSPPILPPICDLFQLPPGAEESRPLHKRSRPDMALLPVSFPSRDVIIFDSMW